MKQLLISLFAVLLSLTVYAGRRNENMTPVHRPLIEEYTGTWCGWCVRGLVGMELLREEFGEDFIGVAYHNGDPMEIISSSNFPNNIPGYPCAYVDRSYEVDPYYGLGDESAGIISDMHQFAAMEVIAGIEVTARWTSADKTAIAVEATSYFTQDFNAAKYAIEFLLIADDLHGSGSSWNQANYYPQYSYYYAKDPYLGPWTKKSQSVSGIHFNDVLIGTSGVIANSLPTTIVAYDEYSYSYTFTLSALPKPALVQNKDNLHVIAVVTNRTNKKAINANRCFIDEYVEIKPGDVNDDGEVDINDVTLLIDYVLGKDSITINLTNAKLDGDDEISIGDITTLIDIILGHI